MTTAQNLANLSQMFSTQPLMFRNKLINGNFDFWQRGTSLAGAGYLADRWNTYIGGTGTAFTQARGQFPVGESGISRTPAKWYYFNTITNGGDATNGVVVVTQKIEGVDTLRGKITISFGAAVSGTQKIGVNVFQNFGTGGSPSASVQMTAQTVSPVTAFGSNRYSVTFDLPSTVGKTLGSNGDDNIEIAFYFSAGSAFAARAGSIGIQTGTFYLAAVQCESGGVATEFEQRPLALELLMCQRYFEAIGVNGRIVYNQGPTGALMDIPFLAYKRTVTSLTYVGSMPTAENTNTPTAVAIDRSRNDGVQLVWTGSGGPSIGTCGRMLNGGTLQFSAEL